MTELPPKLQARSTNAVTCQAKGPTLDPKRFTSPFGSLNNAASFHLKMQMLLENAGNVSISDTSQDMKLDHKSALTACYFGFQFLPFLLCHFSASTKEVPTSWFTSACRPSGEWKGPMSGLRVIHIRKTVLTVLFSGIIGCHRVVKFHCFPTTSCPPDLVQNVPPTPETVSV